MIYYKNKSLNLWNNLLIPEAINQLAGLLYESIFRLIVLANGPVWDSILKEN